MFRVSLVSMPFAAVETPSMGLTQLRAVLERRFGQSIRVDEVIYANQDFSRFLGLDLYQLISNSAEGMNAGMGDWFFRHAAFPNLPDNSELYYRRYFPMMTKELGEATLKIEEKREGLDEYLGEIVDKYRLDEADVVGLTSVFSQSVGCLSLARKIKERNPQVTVVMGGPNCDSPMGEEYIKHAEQLDYVFSGPALKSFPEFIQHCVDEERERCEQIKGVFSRKNFTSPVSIVGEDADINDLLHLDYDSFLKTSRENFPDGEVETYLIFETSRGCWWGEKAHCTFCGINELAMGYRAMRPEKAVEYINTMLERYGPECSNFECVDYIMPANYPVEVFPHLNTTSDINLFYEVKADLTAEDMEQMSKARIKMIQPGIESLSTPTLKLMKKGTTAFQNLAFLKNCLLYDLSPRWNLLVGFPGEEESVYHKYMEDLPLLVHLPPPGAMAKVQFHRYSPYFMEAERYGLQLRPSDFYPLTYPFSQETLARLAYHHVDSNFKAGYIHTMIKWIVQVGELATRWQKLWKTDGTERPRLFVKERDGQKFVHDTRAGELIEHPLSLTAALVLERLHKPKRVSQLAKEIEGAALAELEDEVQRLRERGLLFQEGDRFLALPLPRETFDFSVDQYMPDIQQLVSHQDELSRAEL
ncbi:MAG TPA: RiPP maturation radical SAM C-methyltransferase [Pyrinomonadaceae bacterium]|nr:RiPP maturation radical SAM C-methyltransferase [Pyrinomonadaceae bacterium]